MRALLNLGEGARAISVDELTGIAALGSPSPDLMPTREYGAIKRDYEYMRFGGSALIAGKDIGTGEEASAGERHAQGSSISSNS